VKKVFKPVSQSFSSMTSPKTNTNTPESHRKTKSITKTKTKTIPKTPTKDKVQTKPSPKPSQKSVPKTKTPDPKKYVHKVSLFTDSRKPISSWYDSYPRKSHNAYKPIVKRVRDEKIGSTKYRDRYGWLPIPIKKKTQTQKENQPKPVKNIRKQLFTNDFDVHVTGRVCLTSNQWIQKDRFLHGTSKVMVNGTPTQVKQVWVARRLSPKTI